MQLCSVNCVQNGDRYFRFLFDLNDTPFKTRIEQESTCNITLHSISDYMVEHIKTVGVYRRGLLIM